MKFINPFQNVMSQIKVDAADFDGSNDYMLLGSGLAGAADSKSGIFSCWHREDADATVKILSNAISIGSATYTLSIQKNASAKYQVFATNSAGVTILNISSATNYATESAWRHILAAWDLAAGIANIYINDADDFTSATTLTDDFIDYTVADWTIGAGGAGGGKLNGCIADCYLAIGQYVDISSESNRRKFISSALRPVSIGSDGSLPTGTAPSIYLHLDDGEAVANFATNRGTGGNFAITGTLDTASTSPSD